jgi:hypothetical protein
MLQKNPIHDSEKHTLRVHTPMHYTRIFVLNSNFYSFDCNDLLVCDKINCKTDIIKYCSAF